MMIRKAALAGALLLAAAAPTAVSAEVTYSPTYGQDRAEIAAVLGVSVPRVHQLKASALEKLRLAFAAGD